MFLLSDPPGVEERPDRTKGETQSLLPAGPLEALLYLSRDSDSIIK